MPKISIIVPVYNAEKYLKESVESILNQSFHDFELILVNDGSKDKSKQICEEFSNIDERVKVINLQNSGSGIARNKGIAIATGEYCYFPDADDILIEDAFKIMNEEINNKNADLYVFGYILTQRNIQKELKRARVNLYMEGNEIRKNYEDYMKEGKTYIQGAPWNKLFKTKNIKENNIEYPNLRRNQDEVFIVRYMNTVKDVKFCDKYIYKYYANDLKEEWKKFPKDYFNIRTEVYKEFKNNIIKWNNENIKTKILINYSYICAVLKCFEYMFNPKWEMNKKTRKDYIKECIENEEVKYALNFLENNKKEIKNYIKGSSPKSLKINLIFFQVNLIKKQRIRTLYIISKLLISIRNSYRNAQYKRGEKRK